jgi:hypothetical protein
MKINILGRRSSSQRNKKKDNHTEPEEKKNDDTPQKKSASSPTILPPLQVASMHQKPFGITTQSAPSPSSGSSAGSSSRDSNRELLSNKSCGVSLVVANNDKGVVASVTPILDYSEQWNVGATPYVDYEDGVLYKNAKPFEQVSHCFICDRQSSELHASVEVTGSKSRHGCDIPVYRQVFRCERCVALSPDKTRLIVISSQCRDRYFSMQHVI